MFTPYMDVNQLFTIVGSPFLNGIAWGGLLSYKEYMVARRKLKMLEKRRIRPI